MTLEIKKEIVETFGLDSDWMQGKIRNEGQCTCPLCGHLHKKWNRRLHSGMALAMLRIAQYFRYNPNAKSCHIEGFLKRTNLSAGARGDAAKLRFWGLIEKADKKGHYKITEDGKKFALRQFKVKSHCWVFHNKPYGLNGEFISISDAMKNKYDYEKLWHDSKIERVI